MGTEDGSSYGSWRSTVVAKLSLLRASRKQRVLDILGSRALAILPNRKRTATKRDNARDGDDHDRGGWIIGFVTTTAGHVVTIVTVTGCSSRGRTRVGWTVGAIDPVLRILARTTPGT